MHNSNLRGIFIINNNNNDNYLACDYIIKVHVLDVYGMKVSDGMDTQQDRQTDCWRDKVHVRAIRVNVKQATIIHSHTQTVQQSTEY